MTNIGSDGNVDVYKLPKVKVTSIVHKGAFATIGEIYNILLTWLEQNHYQVVGLVREIYHKGEWVTQDVDEYVTEIQV